MSKLGEAERLRKWMQWSNQPITSHIVVRLRPDVYQLRPLPEWATTLDDAVKVTCLKARDTNLRCCLVWTRRLCVFCSPDGEVRYTEAAPSNDPAPTGLIYF